jgi:hypothetical protein
MIGQTTLQPTRSPGETEARVADFKYCERAAVWRDGRVDSMLKPGLYALWTIFHDVRFEHADLIVKLV